MGFVVKKKNKKIELAHCSDKNARVSMIFWNEFLAQ